MDKHFVHFITANLNEKGKRLGGKAVYTFPIISEISTLDLDTIVEKLNIEIGLEVVENFDLTCTIETGWTKENLREGQVVVILRPGKEGKIFRDTGIIDNFYTDGTICLKNSQRFSESGIKISYEPYYQRYSEIEVLDLPTEEERVNCERLHLKYKLLEELRELMSRDEYLDSRKMSLEEVENALNILKPYSELY